MSKTSILRAEAKARGELRSLQKQAQEMYFQSEAWSTLRDEVKERYGGNCTFCGSAGTRAHFITPPSQGGTLTSTDNLVWCCAACGLILAWNRNKELTIDEKRALIAARHEQERQEVEDTYL